MSCQELVSAAEKEGLCGKVVNPVFLRFSIWFFNAKNVELLANLLSTKSAFPIRQLGKEKTRRAIPPFPSFPSLSFFSGIFRSLSLAEYIVDFSPVANPDSFVLLCFHEETSFFFPKGSPGG